MSILAALEKAKENVARFKKAKCMLQFLQHRKGNLEQLHDDSVRLAHEYADSAKRTAALLAEVNKQMDSFSKFVEDNHSTIDDGKNAEAIAAKIIKLQKEIAALQEKLEAEDTHAKQINSSAQAGT